jgi:hypothetical protein
MGEKLISKNIYGGSKMEFKIRNLYVSQKHKNEKVLRTSRIQESWILVKLWF